MRVKIKSFSNFTKTRQTENPCYRPEKERELDEVFQLPYEHLLIRGNGLSYNDSNLIQEGLVVDNTRLNHFISFDDKTGFLVTQSGVTFQDLLAVHPEFIPPVLPGTLKATLAGGIAHEVHGKNNPQEGTLGHHIQWFDLQVAHETYRCSLDENPELFKATLGGLGLTGLIKRVCLRLKKASHQVLQKTEAFSDIKPLLERMKTNALKYDYQAAWLDLINEPKALLSTAQHTAGESIPTAPPWSIPPLPCRVLTQSSLKHLNRIYFQKAAQEESKTALITFNNPLDKINHWQRLYGKKGLIQFQGVFDENVAFDLIQDFISLIRSHEAVPTLAVLKYFTKPGLGLLSFVKPGFTLAIDFIHSLNAIQAVCAMNERLMASQGRLYLAKDLFMTPEQFQTMYSNTSAFQTVLHQIKSPMRSNLASRLGLQS